jgi:Zn finger protein HypA/HybF involved in hydrogenase expression
MSLNFALKSPPIAGPNCSKCGLPMLLLEVQSDKRKWKIHLFECPQCEAQKAHIVKKPRT